MLVADYHQVHEYEVPTGCKQQQLLLAGMVQVATVDTMVVSAIDIGIEHAVCQDL